MAKSKTSPKSSAKKTGSSKASSASKKTSSASKKTSSSKSSAKSSTKGKTKRTPNAAFMKPMTPSAELAAVVGNKPLPRTEAVKKTWDYIKKNNLQDPKEKRNINADANLQKVFGGKKKVSMFEMAKHLNNNLS